MLLYRFRPWSPYLQQEIEKGDLYFSSMNDQNDLHEGCLETVIDASPHRIYQYLRRARELARSHDLYRDKEWLMGDWPRVQTDLLSLVSHNDRELRDLAGRLYAS
jgi:hypothetical protein